MISAALLAVTVAFPRPGMTLPPVDVTYMSGAVPRGVTNLVVQGKGVDIFRNGGWVTMVSVTGGVNNVEIKAGGVTTNVVLKVERKAPPKLGADGKPLPPPPPRVFEKLPYASDTAQNPPKGRKPADIVVVVDPGHGGAKDTGAVSPHGFFEKDANLALANDVAKALRDRGYTVVMTRTNDVPVELYERARWATEKKADAFISIHHNAPPCNRDPRKVRYTAVYEWNTIGRELAAAINLRMGEALEGDIPNNGVLHANFVVTRNPQVPSCLVETDFITTPEGELAIWNPPRRRVVASAIAEGFADWCSAAGGDDGGADAGAAGTK